MSTPTTSPGAAAPSRVRAPEHAQAHAMGDATGGRASTSAGTGTVTLHRVLRAPPGRVYAAFLDPDAMAKWLPPHGFTGRVLEMDAREGGRYRMQFTNFGTGQTQAFGGEYLELVPGQRIVHTDRFDGTHLPGEMRTTATFRAVSVGTELVVVQAGIPAMIPEEACYQGWQASLQLLALLVEPEIPG